MSRMKRALLSAVSKVASVVNLAPISPEFGYRKVTPKLGKPKAPNRRLIDYERTGPFHRQVGITWLHGEAWPIMQTYFVHRFLHATKGWRTYVGGQAMRLPMPNPQWRGAYR